MANILKNAFLSPQLPTLAFKRFRGKINIQRPRKHFFERALVLQLTKPIYPKKERVKPCPIESKFQKDTSVVNPYEKIIAKEVRNWFDHSKMVGIVHLNSINSEDFFRARVAFHKSGMQLKKYGISILRLALNDSKYECINEINRTKFFSTGFIFSTEHAKVNTMMKILNKIPQLELLCGIAEGRLLSKNEFVDYGNMPDIQIVRSQFANVLQLAGNTIVQNLQSHQLNLTNILDAHVRLNQSSNESKKKESALNNEITDKS